MDALPSAIRCHAKLNLGLQVRGALADGYHEIRTVFHTIELHDTLEASPASRNSLEVVWAGDGAPRAEVPAGAENLVMKAAEALAERTGRAATAFRLVKRIPPEAGLGGGSSDAAGALLAIDRVHRLGLDASELHEIASGLGADVPFFLYGGAALGLGKGSEVYPLPDGPDFHVVVAMPGEGLSTREVYGAWDDLLTSRSAKYSMSDFAPWCLVLRGELPCVANDLEEAAIRLRPSLKGLRTTLETSGARAVAMTGSGAAFFGLFEEAGPAEAAAGRAREAGYAAMTSRTLGRDGRDRSLWSAS